MRAMLLGMLVLAGCSGPYSVLSQTPHTLALCWDPILYAEQRAADQAQAHCAAQGLTARVHSRGRCGFGGANAMTAFECITPPTAR